MQTPQAILSGPPPTSWSECHTLLLQFPTNALVHLALEAAVLVLPIWNDAVSNTALGNAPLHAIESVKRWQSRLATAEDVRVCAEAAYLAASKCRTPAGTHIRSSGFAAAHAAFAAYFYDAFSDSNSGKKVFGATRDSCLHANVAAAKGWGDFSIEWSHRWWESCGQVFKI